MPQKNSFIRLLHLAAADLARDHVLNDPTDDEILLAACELQMIAPRALENLTDLERSRIITTYDLTQEGAP